jgi:transcription antitermination protein NusB
VQQGWHVNSNDRFIAKLAFQALFQIDAQWGGKATIDAQVVEMIRHALMVEDHAEPAIESALTLASLAWANRHLADKATSELAPTWPAHRQAAADRAVLRLAYHLLMSCAKPEQEGGGIVDLAVGIAKDYSTEKSPAFVNALLDKVLKSRIGKSAQDADGATGGA